jgi:hypothetical protein
MSFRTLTDSLVDLCQEVFGAECTYTPDGGSPVTINGVFDNAYVDVEGVVTLKPTLRIALDDLEAEPGKGDEVTVDEVAYRVMESREDGFGGTTLILQKA